MAEPDGPLLRRAKRLLEVSPDLATCLRAVAAAVDEPDDAELVTALAQDLEDDPQNSGPGDDDDDDDDLDDDDEG